MKKNCLETVPADRRLTTFDRFLGAIGRSRVWGWRARRRGWIQCVNIAGRLYVSAAEVERFTDRAAAGEFAQLSTTRLAKTGDLHD